MSAVVKAATADLVAALSAVPGVRYQKDLGGNLAPPAIVLAPPSLAYTAMCDGPTEATYRAFLVVKADDRTVDRLLDLIELVTDAVEGNTPAAVTGATPLAFNVSNTELPAYQITIEYPL